MKYIRNRNQFKTSHKLFEQSGSEKIYDGSWEDTFVGRFFSFLGRKITHKMKKGGLNKLLKQLENEFEKITFVSEIENESQPAQFYRVYQNIVMIKSYIKNSNNFNTTELKEMVESAIEEHEKSSENEKLPSKVKKAHTEVKDGMEELLNFINNNQESLNEGLILEFLTDQGKDKGYLYPGEILAESWMKPIKGDVKLSKLKLTGNQKGYKEYKNEIRDRFKELSRNLREVIPYTKEEIKPDFIKLINLLSEASFDDFSSFANDFDKNINPLVEILISKHNNYLKDLSKKDSKKDKKDKLIKDIKNDPDKVLLKWVNKKGIVVVGWTENKDILNIINDNNEIDISSWNDVKENENSKVKVINGGDISFFQLDNTIKRGDFIQIGDVTIKSSKTSSKLRDNINKKVDEIFPNDQDYKNFMQISDSELEEVHQKLLSKKEDQKNVVDPITILKIFNRAYNSFSITKEEYDSFSEKYSKKVAGRKKSRFEVIGDTARDKKLFQEWNDGVLSLLQQYGDLLNKPTKQFIIEMLDDNKLFGNRGGQSKLLSKYFNVPLDDATKKVNKIKDSPGEHRVRVTEDNSIKFQSVKNIEMNTDKIRRIPFIMEVVLDDGTRTMITIYPLSASKSKDISNIKVKFVIGKDYGFIKNYMKGINVNLNEENLKDELKMNSDDTTPVHIGKILSDNGFIEKNNSYKLTEIRKLKDDEGISDKNIDVYQIYMLLGEKDEGMYRLPSLNDEMKKSIKDSENDSFV